jgi:hypothetical protein
MEKKQQSKKATDNQNGDRSEQRANTITVDSNMKKDPDEWTTGDEPMTGAQHPYLKTLSDEAR